MFNGHHATVDCPECLRMMVPRVITYYGHPKKSICPFCGATFARFPSGIGQFLQHFSQKSVSFDVFKRITLVAIGFDLIWLLATMEILPSEIEALGVFGSIIFGAFSLAELFYQTTEFIAQQLSHNSSYYWSAIALIAILIPYVRDDLTHYILITSFLMIARWILAGFAAAKNRSH
jgi:ribosomal protein S27E